MKKSKKKEQFVDDNRTIVDMNVDGFPWYDGSDQRTRRQDKKAERKDRDKPTAKERLKMIFGMYRALLPFLLITIGCFTLVFVLLYVAFKLA